MLEHKMLFQLRILPIFEFHVSIQFKARYRLNIYYKVVHTIISLHIQEELLRLFFF